MSIDPTKSGGGQPIGSPRIDQASSNESARRPEVVRGIPADGSREAQRSRDQVRLSDEARAATRTEGETSPSGISGERMREILKRLTSGYYDNPEVRERIAQRIHEKWGRGDVHID